MKIRKILFVGALIIALGFGAILTPVVGMAQNNTQVPGVNNTNQTGLGLGLGKYNAGTMRDTVASTLGITVDELYSLRLSGQSIAQIGENRGYTYDQLLNVMTVAKIEQVEQLYQDGVITADQKAYILSQLEAKMEYKMNRTTVGGSGYGKGGGKGYSGSGGGYGSGYWSNTNN